MQPDPPKIDIPPAERHASAWPAGSDTRLLSQCLQTLCTLLGLASAEVRRLELRTRLGQPLAHEEIACRCNQVRGSISIKGVAEGTGYHAETVRRYLNGETRPPSDFIAVFAAMFSVDPCVLLFDTSIDGRSTSRESPAELGRELVGALLRLIEAAETPESSMDGREMSTKVPADQQCGARPRSAARASRSSTPSTVPASGGATNNVDPHSA